MRAELHVFNGTIWVPAASVTVGATTGLAVVEQQAPQAEDNTNGVYLTTDRPLATATYAPTLHTNFGAATKANVKASAGNVLAFHVINQNAAGRYFQLHNKASAPAAAETPLYSFKVPAGTADAPGVLHLDHAWFCGSGAAFATGIGWAISTTLATFTDAAAAGDHAVHVMFK